MSLWSVGGCYFRSAAATLCLIPCLALALSSRCPPGWFLLNSSTTNSLDLTHRAFLVISIFGSTASSAMTARWCFGLGLMKIHALPHPPRARHGRWCFGGRQRRPGLAAWHWPAAAQVHTHSRRGMCAACPAGPRFPRPASRTALAVVRIPVASALACKRRELG